MNTFVMHVENIKCHGCANTITKDLLKSDVIKTVVVDVAEGTVTVQFDGPESILETCRLKLMKLGYPEAGSNTVVSRAKSYISCAIGRFGEKE